MHISTTVMMVPVTPVTPPVAMMHTQVLVAVAHTRRAVVGLVAPTAMPRHEFALRSAETGTLGHWRFHTRKLLLNTMPTQYTHNHQFMAATTSCELCGFKHTCVNIPKLKASLIDQPLEMAIAKARECNLFVEVFGYYVEGCLEEKRLAATLCREKNCIHVYITKDTSVVKFVV